MMVAARRENSDEKLLAHSYNSLPRLMDTSKEKAEGNERITLQNDVYAN
jgi:hypothetical protein